MKTAKILLLVCLFLQSSIGVSQDYLLPCLDCEIDQDVSVDQDRFNDILIDSLEKYFDYPIRTEKKLERLVSYQSKVIQDGKTVGSTHNDPVFGEFVNRWMIYANNVWEFSAELNLQATKSFMTLEGMMNTMDYAMLAEYVISAYSRSERHWMYLISPNWDMMRCHIRIRRIKSRNKMRHRYDIDCCLVVAKDHDGIRYTPDTFDEHINLNTSNSQP